jgi:hypothetical protein
MESTNIRQDWSPASLDAICQDEEEARPKEASSDQAIE